MSISVKFLQHPQAFAPEVEPRPVEQSKPAQRRTRRAQRTKSTLSPAQAVAGQEIDALFTAIVPPQPRSLFQRQMYLGNMALLGQVVQQKGIAQGVIALGRSGPGTGTGGGPGTGTGTVDFPDDPPLGGIGYEILARLIAIAAQLADTNNVTLFSHLEKLDKFTHGQIAQALEMLRRLEMKKTFEALANATDREPFAKLVEAKDPVTVEFQRLFRAACRELVAAQFWCLLEAPDDDVIETAQGAPIAAQAAATRAVPAARRAQRTARAAKKPVKPQRKR